MQHFTVKDVTSPGYLTKLRKQIHKNEIQGRDMQIIGNKILEQMYTDAVEDKQQKVKIIDALQSIPRHGKRLDGSTSLAAFVLALMLTKLASKKADKYWAAYLIGTIGKTLGAVYISGGGVAEVLKLWTQLFDTFLDQNELNITEKALTASNSVDLIFDADETGNVIIKHISQ